MSSVFCKKLFGNENNDMEEKFPVSHLDCPGGPIDRDGVEVEDMGKGLEMMRCFERGE